MRKILILFLNLALWQGSFAETHNKTSSINANNKKDKKSDIKDSKTDAQNSKKEKKGDGSEKKENTKLVKEITNNSVSIPAAPDEKKNENQAVKVKVQLLQSKIDSLKDANLKDINVLNWAKVNEIKLSDLSNKNELDDILDRYPTWYLLVLLLIILALIIWIIIQKRMHSSDIESIVYDKTKDWQIERNELKNKYSEESRKVYNLTNQLNSLDNLKQKSIPTKEKDEQPFVIQKIITVEEKISKLFSDPPSNEREFDSRYVLEKLEQGSSMYEFSSISGSNKFKFRLIRDENNFKKALSTPDYCINYVCERQGEYGQTKKIIYVEDGEVELQGDKWIVTKKAIIRYE
jgi:hypothetical protein